MRIVIAIAALAVLLTGCSSSTSGTSGASSARHSNAALARPSSGMPATSTSTTAVAVPNPCTALSKADVQPFLTVPIQNALPQPLPGKACTWSGDDGNGGLATSITIDLRGGSDATDWWQMASGPTAKPVLFNGVGAKAEHIHGFSDFVALNGDLACGLTTVGSTHIAGKLKYPAGQLLSDAAATTIAQQLGTLCNRLFGSGSTTPTMTAPAPTGSASGAVPAGTPAPSGSARLARTFPLPQGVDCSGAKTVTTSEDITCTTTLTIDPRSVYAFYVKTIPTVGYTINHESETFAAGKEIASLLFSGGQFKGFCNISIVGKDLVIGLAKQ